MCDYSLHGIRNRLAKEDEVLVVHRFHTGSKGLTSLENLNPTERPKGLLAAIKALFAAQPQECAVCIPDGAKLIIHGISPKLQEYHSFNSVETVTFRQLSADAHNFRDAVEFKNGMKVRLQDLQDGQRVEVLTLTSENADIQLEVLTDIFE
jgi:hypothetical protein